VRGAEVWLGKVKACPPLVLLVLASAVCRHSVRQFSGGGTFLSNLSDAKAIYVLYTLDTVLSISTPPAGTDLVPLPCF